MEPNKFNLSLFFYIFCINLCYSQVGFNQGNLINKNAFEYNLSGVKYAYYEIDQLTLNFNNKGIIGSNNFFYNALERYLKELKFENVFSDKYKPERSLFSSLCNAVYVKASWNYSNNYYDNIVIDFYFCNGDYYSIYSNSRIYDSRNSSLEYEFLNEFYKIYSKEKSHFQLDHRLELPIWKSDWNEINLKDYLQNNLNLEIVGIYEEITTDSKLPKLQIGIVKNGEDYIIIHLSGGTNFEDWVEGEFRGTMQSTGVYNMFKTAWVLPNKVINKQFFISLEEGILNLFDNETEVKFIKLFPKFNTQNNRNNVPPKSTGSGFSISTDGLVVTNYHVIKGANLIKIKGINGDFEVSYLATVLLSDEKNDLSILKINDSSFKLLRSIPYSLSTKTQNVGTEIFVLGYPLPSTMGTEIKLTNGIINSKTGYKNDPTTYQVSAPVQPGNSGGPMLSESGDIIGIISSKHLETENVTYAIKSSILTGMIETLEDKPDIQTFNSLKSLSLSEKVKILKNFIYIIEVY